MIAAPLTIRPARESDRAPVLEFCRQTWAWGDYLDAVWDAWLADPQGLFAVGEVDGHVVGVDKLTILGAGEAFFEGLRIDPAYRGHGYAGQFERHMLGEAARQGARVVRFLTASTNTAIHHIAERDGFRRGPLVRPWNATAAAPGDESPLSLTPLAPGPATAAAWAALPAGPLWPALGGLLSAHWHLQSWTPALWDQLLAAGTLLAAAPDAVGEPPGLVALLPGSDPETGWLAWIAATPFVPSTLAVLAHAARGAAAAACYTTLQALLPPIPALDAGLQAAGWTPSSDDSTLLVFEKPLAPR